jgi:hypothetical protein
MAKVAPPEVRELAKELEVYHAQHAELYGPMETCTQATCVEVKNGIQWLRERLSGATEE